MNIFKVDKDSWLIRQENNTSWMLTYYNGVYSLLKDGNTHRYNNSNIHKLLDAKKLDFIRKSRIKNNTTGYVCGTSVKHAKMDCIDDGSGTPLFKKNKSSDTVYCAGYYALYTHGTWLTRFCPKQTTINTCKKYIGPFYSEEQLSAELSKLKKQ